MGIALNFHIAFASMAIFTVAVVTMYKHGSSFHSLIPSLIYFFSVLKFSNYYYKLSFVWIELSQDIFDAIVKGIVFFISFSVYLLSVYTKVSDFWVLILFLLHCKKCLSAVDVFWWSFVCLLCVKSYHLQIKIFWLFHFLFLSLNWRRMPKRNPTLPQNWE